jgi:hypothetical protein
MRRINQSPGRGLLSYHLPFPRAGRVLACLSILGLVSLGYLAGAAAMYFQLPSADFLDKAFTGARAWHEQGRAQNPPAAPSGAQPDASVDQPAKTYDGFTLYTSTLGTRATLMDMRGKEVHHWELPFSKAFPRTPHIKKPVHDGQIHWFRCHLYPNGDLLAVYHADGDTPYGYGLAKLDKDSRLLWAYPGRVHHDVDVGEDGTIYTLSQQLIGTSVPGRLLPTPYIEDFLVMLSPQGQELQTMAISEAFRDTPYLTSLNSVTKCSNIPVPGQKQGDFLHANSVRVLSPARAAKFRPFKPNQVLVSLRDLDALVVLDPPTRSVAWSLQGIWRIQHDADFLDNGNILLFDNFGSIKGGSRVLELDPRTQAIAWSYTNENATPFSAYMRGAAQRLPNGNTLIVDPDHGRLFEVAPSKEIVWEYMCPLPAVPHGKRIARHAVTSARRYGPKELTFLHGVAQPRP